MLKWAKAKAHQQSKKAEKIVNPVEKLDPLTAIHRLRQWQRASADETLKTVPVFDGRKRYDLRAREANGRMSRLEVMLVGIAGFDHDDPLVSFPENGAMHWLTLDLTDSVPVVPRRIADGTTTGPVIELLN